MTARPGNEPPAPHARSEGVAPGAPPSAGFTPAEARQAGRLTLVVILVAAFFVVEFAGALFADSVVLQADALHLLTDVVSLGTSLAAMRLAVSRATSRFTFGLRRAEPLAAIFSAVLVLVTAGLIVDEGVHSLLADTPPKPGVMLIVAVVALIVNGISAWLLHDVMGRPHAHGEETPHDHDSEGAVPLHDGAPHAHDEGELVRSQGRHAHGHALNLRGAWLHLVGDTLGAVAALIAAIVIRLGGPSAADPVASFFVAAILVFAAFRLLRDAVWVLLEAVPTHLSVPAIRTVIEAFPGVLTVNELRVWALGAGHDALVVHVGANPEDATLGRRLGRRLRTAFGVEYVTVQIDPPNASLADRLESRSRLAEPT